jgi:hypothetical protein
MAVRNVRPVDLLFQRKYIRVVKDSGKQKRRNKGQTSTERGIDGLGSVKRHDRREAGTGFGDATVRRTVQFEQECTVRRQTHRA